MTRTMYDSTNVADDPLGADLVAYYVDGIYATTAAKVRQRFPRAVLVAISAIGTNAGIAGDVEPGCMTVNQAIAWVIMRRGAGVDPSLYVNEVYGWPVVRQAFQRAGVPEPHWWVADYDNRPLIPDGAVAKQYENPPLTHGHFDRSVVADYWPGVDGLAGAATQQLEANVNAEEKKGLVRLAYVAGTGRQPELNPKTGISDVLMGWVAKIGDDGSNLDFVIASITNSTEAQAHLTRLAAAGPGEKGDKGDKGDPGQDGKPGKDAPQLPAPPAGVLDWLQKLLDFFKPKAAA